MNIMAIEVIIVIFVGVSFQWAEASNRYWLYDHYSKNWTEMDQNGTAPKSGWYREQPVKVLVHGYNSNSLSILQLLEAHYMTILAKEYAKYERYCNIIAVDWSKLADNPLHKYADTAKNVKPAGDEVAEYFVLLFKNGAFTKFKNVHFLGLSIGAHVSGYTGYTIERLTNGEKLGRITGLDPAGPFFTTMIGTKSIDMKTVLDYEDADFVDIIHTNMGKPNSKRNAALILNGKLGSALESGHIDFYPNGGELQTDQCDRLKEHQDNCAHQMSVLFYAYSLRRPKKYIACPCDNYVRYLRGRCECEYPGTGQPIGDLTRPAPRGRYYLTITDPISPDTFRQ